MLSFPSPSLYLSIYLLYLSSPSLTFLLLPLCCHCWCCRRRRRRRCCFSVSKLSNVAGRPWNLSPTKIPSNSSTMLPRRRRSHRRSSSIELPKSARHISSRDRQSAEIRAFLQCQATGELSCYADCFKLRSSRKQNKCKKAKSFGCLSVTPLALSDLIIPVKKPWENNSR